MDERGWLTERFDEHRTHLRAVAYRMLARESRPVPGPGGRLGSRRSGASAAGRRRVPKDGTITEIEVIADPDRLRHLDLAVLDSIGTVSN
jgi:hypothetical protein